jgi:diguanylate cyclase (GGDEF)-like protein/PAS domain S-box-containing protein
MKKSIIVARVFLITVVVAIVCYVEYLQFQTEKEQQKLALTQSLSFLHGDIEATIYRNVELVKGLAAYISINPNMTQDEFSEYVEQLLKSKSNIRHLAAARNYIITHLYPYIGNEQAFGVDYRQVTDQLGPIQTAIKYNEIVLAGPVQLVQGGTGIIGRLPVFIEDKNWGLVSIVMDYDSLLNSLNLEAYSNIDIAIRGIDSKGNDGDVFYGDKSLFTSPSITQVIKLPYGSWVIAARPKQGWMSFNPHFFTWAFASIIIFALLYSMNLRFKNINLAIEKQKALTDSEEKFRNFFNLNSVVMLIVDEFGVIKNSNESAQLFYGYSEEELTGLAIEVLEPDTKETAFAGIRFADSQNKNIITSQHKMKNGEIKDVKICSTPVELDGQTQLFSIIFDITDQRELEKQWRLFEQVYRNAQEGIFVTDEIFSIISANPAFEKITGYCEKEVINENPSVLDSDVHDEQFYKKIFATLRSKGSWRGEIWNKNKDGTVYPQLSSISEVRNEANQICNYIGVFSDISQQKQSETKLEKLAHFDQLTGLPNRLTLKLHLEKALQLAKFNETQCALLFLDLDRFKVINDSLGHSAGDELLLKVGLRLKDRLRSKDILARLGGDEFVILITDYEDESQLAFIANDLCRHLQMPFKIVDETEANLGASIGIAQYPKDSTSADELLKYADASMYKAKSSKDINYIFYNQNIILEANNKLTIASEIKRAINENEFELFLQPQYDLSTGSLLGAEGLIRWNHPQKGFLTPDKFIPLAESTGAIKLITAWVVDEVFEIVNQWRSENRDLNLSFNVSALEFADKDLFTRIMQKSKIHPDASHYLTIEIVESALVEHLDFAKDILHNLRKEGFKVAIDDFGTGFSSLSYLAQLPMDILKIDRVFVDKMESDLQNGIVKSIIDLASNFSLMVTAEGIESEKQIALLLKMGCTVGQGFFYSKPITLEHFTERCL